MPVSRASTAKSAAPGFIPIIQSANLSHTPIHLAKERRVHRDPYKIAQAEQRKNANLKRREELESEREAEMGDPIWGKGSAFTDSLRAVGQPGAPAPQVGAKAAHKGGPGVQTLRNHFVTDAELEEAVEHAFTLTKPLVSMVESQIDSSAEAEKAEQHKQNHLKAVEALRRITALENSSARDRYHVSVRRIIDELGRHNTDNLLKPRPQSITPNKEPKAPRAGPDTGSSEVQIGILTTKIQTLAHALTMNRGYKDKHNKRNLRLLLHRRQRLLKYMERKERGSERWTNMLETLGLTPATWKRQIDL
ncbi:hypothetical protein S40288_00625 [Stachybotrys chartarum IBT 40288]|nr:hypothetical protein S40288_00625 [Stachybotrys chartarum IBT 40288]